MYLLLNKEPLVFKILYTHSLRNAQPLVYLLLNKELLVFKILYTHSLRNEQPLEYQLLNKEPLVCQNSTPIYYEMRDPLCTSY